ncbi:MAG TPA: hypothetical protein VES64_00625 [Allosphingosinicella sp.]|nr:hypothetical protein [Allosphingosinicella sp.]
MNEVIGARPPGWFRVVAMLAVLWNLIGVWQYLSFVGMAPMMKEATAAQLEVVARAPMWIAGAFAIAVFGGLLGSIGLVLGKAWARLVLILSLIAMVTKFGWWCFMSGLMELEGNAVLVMPAVVIAIAVLLIWIANMGVKKGWLT